MLLRLSTIETKYSSRVRHLIGAVSHINEDGSFVTTCQGLGSKNSFGRDMSVDVYRHTRRPYSDVSDVKPLVPVEVFELTDDPKECVLLRITNTVFGGHDYKDVVEVISDKIFIVDEKLYIKGGRSKNEGKGMIFATSEKDNDSGVNTVLNYMGLEHYPKETPRYEGDCNTAIGLMPNCKYEMYKLVKKYLPISK